MKHFIIALFAILLTFSNIQAATIKGKILDDKGKPFKETLGIMTISNTMDGTQEIHKHNVDKRGNYIIKTDNIGYCQVLVGFDTVDKFLLPIWLENGKTYDLNINLPHTKYPYINMSQAKLKSKNKDLVKNILIIDSLLSNVDLCAVYLRGYINHNVTENYANKTSILLDQMSKNYKETKENGVKFMAGICYINSIDCLTPLKETARLDYDLLNDFTKKYNYKTEYFYTVNVNWVNVALLHVEEFETEYLKDMQKNNSIFVKSEILAQATAYYFDVERNKEKSATYYKQLQEKYPYQQSSILAKLKYDPDKKIQVGKPLPNFEGTSLEGTTKFNNDYFKGKYLLIHFWVTSAPENNVQVSQIAASLSQFFDKEYEVLSISLDKSDQEVIDYRLNVNPMKWNHFIDYEQGRGTIGKVFEIYKIPSFILVSPDGTILALDDDLSHTDLLKALEKFIQ